MGRGRSGERHAPAIFLSGPITNAITPDGFDPGVRSVLEDVATMLEREGFRILSAHRAERWGEEIPDQPAAVFRRDWRFACDCDAVVVVLPGDGDGRLYRSDGAFMEIGWAIALGKPLFLVADLSALHRSYLFDGLLDTTASAWVCDVADAPRLAKLATVLRDLLMAPHRSGGRRIALCATSFGYGPVSKAVAVAASLRGLRPRDELVFLGDGLTERYARATGVFDNVVSVDSDREPARCVEIAREFDGLVNSLNLSVLEHWDDSMPPQFLLDSLAWMWPSSPVAVARAHTYFVQDYLLDARTSEDDWPPNAVLVPPIVSPAVLEPRFPWEAESGYVLVNLGGCHNPILPPKVYERYVTTMLAGLAEKLRRDTTSAAAGGRRYVVCGNDDLLRAASSVDWSGIAGQVSCRFLPHAAFLAEMRRCELLLTSPGLTTTLEALGLDVPCRMLLPQNYSQFRIDRHYRSLGLGAGLWPEPLESPLLDDSAIDEEQGVGEVARLVDRQLDRGAGHFADVLDGLLASDVSLTDPLRPRLYAFDGSTWVAEHVLRALDGRSASEQARTLARDAG